ncbi:gamma carbonic anhydrase family protein [SAR202 cluster bacterium AC-409-J13_OGT_754m]|nr:gamma carbonic anhydrase family protein [SAR202 cluster bacterium AC-409-J13_OGT_754m]
MIRSIEGKTPRIHPSVFVSESAYVVGDVEIGEGSSVWPGAVVRGDYGRVVIGQGTNIQDNAVVHSDNYLEIGNNVSVTHGAVIHCSKVGNNVMVGVNAVLLEDAAIGENCIIGAGSVVLPNSIVPPNSVVVGVPGRIMPLKKEFVEKIAATATRYQYNGKRFLNQGLD